MTRRKDRYQQNWLRSNLDIQREVMTEAFGGR